MKPTTNEPDAKVCPGCGESLMTYFSQLNIWCCPKCSRTVMGIEAKNEIKTPTLGGLYSRLKYEFQAIKESYAMCKLAQRRKEWLRDVRSGKIYVGMNDGDTK